MATAALVSGGRAMVSIFDGTRQPFPKPENLLLTVTNGGGRVVARGFHDGANTFFTDLPISNNAADDYTFLASAKGYKDAGFFPVPIAAAVVQPVNLMLIPRSSAFNFAQAKWNGLATARPKLRALLASGASDDAAAAQRYSDLEDVQAGAVLACLLNIGTAAEQIFLPSGTVLDYFKEVVWDLAGDQAMAQDRFYAWADSALMKQLDLAKAQGVFADAPVVLHPGATRSYKQISFGEANLQVTFHEGDTKIIDGVDCVKIEPDIDYFRDSAAHLLLEVVVNAFGSLTDPKAVYALRWIAGQRAGTPEFDPLYTIVAA